MTMTRVLILFRLAFLCSLCSTSLAQLTDERRDFPFCFRYFQKEDCGESFIPSNSQENPLSCNIETIDTYGSYTECQDITLSILYYNTTDGRGSPRDLMGPIQGGSFTTPGTSSTTDNSTTIQISGFVDALNYELAIYDPVWDVLGYGSIFSRKRETMPEDDDGNCWTLLLAVGTCADGPLNSGIDLTPDVITEEWISGHNKDLYQGADCPFDEQPPVSLAKDNELVTVRAYKCYSCSNPTDDEYTLSDEVIVQGTRARYLDEPFGTGMLLHRRPIVDDETGVETDKICVAYEYSSSVSKIGSSSNCLTDCFDIGGPRTGFRTAFFSGTSSSSRANAPR